MRTKIFLLSLALAVLASASARSDEDFRSDTARKREFYTHVPEGDGVHEREHMDDDPHGHHYGLPHRESLDELLEDYGEIYDVVPREAWYDDVE